LQDAVEERQAEKVQHIKKWWWKHGEKMERQMVPIVWEEAFAVVDQARFLRMRELWNEVDE
jgi:hypothetical protein